MEENEFFKRSEEILEEISCWNGFEWEALKLFCLFSRCHTMKHEGQEVININYVREKVFNLLDKYPILLSGDAQRMYIAMRIEKENSEIYMRKKHDNL